MKTGSSNSRCVEILMPQMPGYRRLAWYWLQALMCIALLAAAMPSFAQSDRHMVFISDLHLGAGRDVTGQWQRTEDFRWQEDFDKFLANLEKQGSKIDLVFLGDVFELWQSPTMNCRTDISTAGCKVPDCHEKDTDIGCTESEAVARLKYTLQQHREFTESLGKFAKNGEHRVFIVPGNHDAGLLFPMVGAELMSKLPSGRVQLVGAGYWMSADGLVYADHGHQSDLLNRFGDWPKPFVHRDGVVYLKKPWGENMVQQFYNQYEQVYPIIDNLSDEAAGMGYAISQAGFTGTVDAVGKFFRFLLFEQSLSQALALLDKKDDQSVRWNLSWVRAQPASFFLGGLTSSPALYQEAVALEKKGALDFSAASMTDEEINVFCLGKAARKDGNPCPREGTEPGTHAENNLSALAQGLLLTDVQVRTNYLRDVIPKVAAKPNKLASVYIYGHTHKSAPPDDFGIGDVGTVSLSMTIANTGAFQRTATPVQIAAIMADATYRGSAKSPLELQPEQLPHCYNFVWIKPYQTAPAPKLWRWAEDIDLKGTGFQAEPGTCASRPLVVRRR